VRIVVMLRGRGAAGPVQTIARQAGATLVPQHPGVADPELSRWYVANVQDALAAERLVVALRASEEVEGAYVKPEEEPAGPDG
jgi:hypothetical protein